MAVETRNGTLNASERVKSNLYRTFVDDVEENSNDCDVCEACLLVEARYG